jgi:peptide chain release factor subunit 3
LKVGTPTNDAPAKVLSIGSKPAEPKVEVAQPAKVETPKPEPPKVAEKKDDSKPTSRSSTPKPAAKKPDDAAKAEEKAAVEEDLEAVDDEVIEDLYGKEHLNVVFMGHVG